MKLGQMSTSDVFDATTKKGGRNEHRTLLAGHWGVKCFNRQGELKWEDHFDNIIVNEGLDHALDVVLASGTQITTGWFIGLTNTSPTPAAADTLASHGGWVENYSYSESVRQAFVPAAVSSQSTDNSSNKASFAIAVDGQTIGGAFLSTDNAPSGTSGTLWAVGAFSGGDKSADSGDTLEVQATFTSADDGA